MCIAAPIPKSIKKRLQGIISRASIVGTPPTGAYGGRYGGAGELA